MIINRSFVVIFIIVEMERFMDLDSIIIECDITAFMTAIQSDESIILKFTEY